MIKKILFLFSIIIISAENIFAQAEATTVDERANNFLRESDKLYSVIAVLVIIFIVIITYLVYQDLKIKKLEKDLTNKYPKNL